MIKWFRSLLTWISRLFGTQEYPIVRFKNKLSNSDLNQIFDDITQTRSFQYLLYQTITEHELVNYPEQVSATAYHEAYAFSPKGELHWCRDEWLQEGNLKVGWQVVFVGNRTHCPQELLNAQGEDLNSYSKQVVTVKLWGDRASAHDTWLEQRIPRRLNYPWPYDSKWVGMVINQYSLNGQIGFTQLAGLAHWPKEPEDG